MLSPAFIDGLLPNDAGPWWTVESASSYCKLQPPRSHNYYMASAQALHFLMPTVQPAIIPSAEDRSSGAYSSHHLTLLLPFAPSLMVSTSHLGSQYHV